MADEDGNSDWSVPDDEVHTLVNDLGRPVGTYLHGRRMDEVMVAWETSLTSTPKPYDGSRRQPDVTSAWAVPSWPPRRSGPG